MKVKETSWYSIFTIIASSLVLIWFKSLYPFPNFAIESPNYFDKLSVLSPGIPLSDGYILFLKYTHPISQSSTWIVIVQYSCIQLSILYLLYTFYSLFKVNLWVFRISLFILILNPLYINIANLITADSFYISISLLFFAQILCFLKYPTIKKVIVTSLIYATCILMDNAASWYILIIILSIIISELSYRKKITGLLICISLSTLLVGTLQVFKKQPLTQITSLNNGWQIASNALFAYQYASSLPINTIPDEYKTLHTLENKHKDSLNTLWIRPDTLLGYYYLIDANSPLIMYLKGSTNENEYLYNEYIEKLYSGYGKYLIQKKPLEYFRHFIAPNLIYYYSPLPESLTWYNKGYDTITNPIKNWFHFSTNKLKSWNDSASIPLMRKQVPIALALIKVIFILLILSYYFITDKSKCDLFLYKAVTIIAATFLIQFLYSICNSPVTIRGQSFIIPLYLTWGMLLINWIFKMTFPSTTAS